MKMMLEIKANEFKLKKLRVTYYVSPRLPRVARPLVTLRLSGNLKLCLYIYLLQKK